MNKVAKRRFFWDNGGKTTVVGLPLLEYRWLLEELHDSVAVTVTSSAWKKTGP